MPGKTLTAGADEVVGRVAGAVLAAIRAETGPTQEELAEQLQVGLSTVQAWESGRRPLVRASFQDVQRGTADCGSTVRRPAFCTSSTRRCLQTRSTTTWRPALPVNILSLLVPDRTLTELLAWPLGRPAAPAVTA